MSLGDLIIILINKKRPLKKRSFINYLIVSISLFLIVFGS